MATVRGYTGKVNNSPQVIIDGIPIADLMEYSAIRDSYDIGPFISEITYSVMSTTIMRIELRTIHNTEFAFDIDKDSFIQGDEGNIYIYGPLRKLFPSLFVDKDLLPWQLVYLESINAPKYYKYKLSRNDITFDDIAALNFHNGYNSGYKAGEHKGKELGYKQGRNDEIADQEKAKERQQNKRKRY